VFGALFTVFGIAALVLAGIGIYGVMAASVRNRTRELGVRMALGATTGKVLRMVLRQGAIQLLVGLLAGLLFGVVLSRGLGMMLFRVQASDPLTFVSVVLVLITTTLLATLLPALRAARVQPLEALRHD
jgi:putative ABC transport system permease protein